MLSLKDLQPIAIKYGYDPNHNLRYLALARLVERYSISELLILGCGKGVLESILPGSVQCTSVDISENDLNIAKEINRGKINRDFIHGDIITLQRPLSRAILISEVLEHVEDHRVVLDTVKRLLTPDGIFIVTFPNRENLRNKTRRFFGKGTLFMSEEHLREYTRGEARGLLTGCGFKIIHEENVYLSFAKEDIMKMFISINGPVRNALLRTFRDIGTYLIFVARKGVLC